VAASVSARLFRGASGALASSKFVLGVAPDALEAASAWRRSHVPPELLARDAGAASGRGADSGAVWQRDAPAPVQTQPLQAPQAAPRRADGAASWRAVAPLPQAAPPLPQPRAAGMRVLTRPVAAAPAEPPKQQRPLLPAPPAKPAWGGAAVAPATGNGAPLRDILADEARAAAARFAATPPRPAAAAAARPQAPPATAAMPPRVLRPGEALPPLAWAKVAGAAPRPPAPPAAAQQLPPSAPVSAAVAAITQARACSSMRLLRLSLISDSHSSRACAGAQECA
jgi:hypothetical protein